ncbi:MAG: leucine-rich repeat domain-containing protein, partial [Spirochaetaceae bacterium]|jgi:hypothetical protein|nr:leucine-rich repeat domain-containing protein [Spirochaetaceae bacterium]
LTPDITFQGASVSPASGAPQDFFNAQGFLPVTYTVTAADGSQASWIVTVKPAPLDSLTAIGEYLDDAEPDIPGGPVPLPVEINLAGNGWTDLLGVIQSKDKNVALDLSACDITGMTGVEGEFDPDYTITTGKAKIVSLVLPDTAESIKAGTSSNDAAFKNFTALTRAEGKAVTAIGDYAFYNCYYLSEAGFPAAKTVGNRAFYFCASLSEVSLPSAQSIGDYAFASCISGLSEISLPAAKTIGDHAFDNCLILSEISLPAVESIGGRAFDSVFGSTSEMRPLTVTLGGTVPSLGTHICAGIDGPKTVTVKVPDNDAWRGIIDGSPYDETGPYTDNWGNGFRGNGWKDDAMIDSYSVQTTISLTVEAR